MSDLSSMSVDLKDIKIFYDDICRVNNKLSVQVYFTNDNSYKGLYIEVPFPKIYLNKMLYDERTVYHEIFHHLNPQLNDGEKFESLLSEWILKTQN